MTPSRWLSIYWYRVRWLIFAALFTVTIVLLSAVPSSHLDREWKWDDPRAEETAAGTLKKSKNVREKARNRATTMTKTGMLTLTMKLHSKVTKSRSTSGLRCSGVTRTSRAECHPEMNLTKDRCLLRGCCWDLVAAEHAPRCYIPVENGGYKVLSRDVTLSGTKLTLLHSPPRPPLSNFSDRLSVYVSYFDFETLRVRITDPNASHYESPVPPVGKERHRDFIRYPVHITSNGSVLIDVGDSRRFEFYLEGLIFSELLIEIKVQLPASIIYGLKSKTSSFFTPIKTMSRHIFYAQHREGGTLLPKNTREPSFYGGHPFLAMLYTPTNSATGIFLLTSNEVEVQLEEATAVTFRTTGGILDFFVFFGPTLSSVVTQYQRLVGFPTMPPYHLLRYRRIEEEVHHDTLGQFTIAKVEDAYKALAIQGQVWNATNHTQLLVHARRGELFTCPEGMGGSRHFLDFTHPAAQAFWIQFINGSRQVTDTIVYTFLQMALDAPCCTDDSLCRTNVLHLSNYRNVRHAYPYFQARITSQALAYVTQKRAGIVSDKTYPRQGRWSGYWVRQPEATWKGLNDSVADLLRYSMYGIPVFGTRLCNFNNLSASDDDVALCTGWLTLATFFPIHRYTASLEEGATAKAFRDTTFMRDYFRPYLYTLLYQSSRYGNMVARPMAFEFQDDPGTREVEHQFMWGSALLVAPRNLPDRKLHEVYFPKGTWFDWQNGRRIESAGQNIFVPARDGKPGVYIKGGTIVPIAPERGPSGNGSLLRVVVAPDSDGYATGVMYTDDGISLYPVEREKYSLVNFIFFKNTLVGYCSPCKEQTDILLNAVTLLGIKTQVKAAFLNGRNVRVKRSRLTRYVKNITHPLLRPFVLVWQ